MTTRRGFTMVELMIGLVLTLTVGGVTYKMLLDSQRITRAQTEQVGVQDNVRSGALIIANELRELGYDAVSPAAQLAMAYVPAVASRSDIQAPLQPGQITYLATRGLGFVCNVTTTAPYKVTVEQGTWSGIRDATTTDSLLVWVENGASTAGDDAWVHFGISAIADENCPPSGGTTPPGRAFTVTAPADMTNIVAVLGQIALSTGGPARLAEVMQMRYYQDATNRYWLGMRSVSGGGAIQPVIGPLADSTLAVRGLTFDYRDANDAVTALPGNVRSILVTLNGITDRAVYGQDVHAAVVDTMSLATRVTLRNTLR